MAEKEEVIIEITVDNESARKNIEEQTGAIVSLENEIKRLQSSQKILSKSNKQNSQEYKQNAELIALNKDELNKANASRRASIKDLNTEKGSLNALRSSLAKNVAERNRINVSTKEGRKRFDELNKTILKQNDSLKKAEQAGGDYRRSVGNYSTALEGAEGAFGGAVSGAKALSKQFLALLANPIVLLIVAIVGALKLLYEAFTVTQEGQDEVRAGQATLSAVWEKSLEVIRRVASAVGSFFSGISDSVSSAGSSVGDWFQENFGGAIDTIVEVGTAVSDFFVQIGEFTGINSVIESVGESVGEVVEEIAEAGKEAYNLEKALIAVEKAESSLEVQTAKSKKKIAELSFESENRNNTEAQRVDFLKQAQAIEQKALDDQLDLLNKKLKITEDQLDINVSDETALQVKRDLEIEIANLQVSSFNLQKSLQSRLEGIKKEGEAKDKKRRAEAQARADKKRKEDEAEANRLKKEQDDADKLEARKKKSAFELEIFRKEQDALAIEDAQARADALIAIDQEKTLALINNDKLLNSEKDKIFEESLVRQAKIQEDADKEKDEKKEEDKASDELVAQSKVDLALDGLEVVAQVAGEESEIAKVAAIGRATINTAQAITNTLANVPAPANVIQAVGTGALGAVQIAKIAGVFEEGGVVEKFAKGGLAEGGIFQGPSHANGGVKFSAGGVSMEAEGGEAIINKKATAKNRGLLSAINASTGGKRFAQGGVIKYQDGGVAFNSSTSGIDLSNDQTRAINQSIASMPAPQVAVTDINKGQRTVGIKQTRATI